MICVYIVDTCCNTKMFMTYEYENMGCVKSIRWVCLCACVCIIVCLFDVVGGIFSGGGWFSVALAAAVGC